MADQDDGFLTRWARRKEQAQRGEELPEAAPATTPAAPAGVETGKTPEEQAEEQAKLIESLPDIDSMTRESDFSVFMQKGVPQALRNKALRKLWRLDPVFANLDGLNDYDEDYTAIGKPLGRAVSTLYKVGRGMAGEPPAPDAAEAKATGAAAEQAPPPGGTAEKTPASVADEAPPEADEADADSAQAAGDRLAGASSGPSEPAGSDAEEVTAPCGPSSIDESKGGAAARRWGRFTS
ncbi:MAG: DUF3306 domain-containing protein [Kiloniellales bacterium]